MQHVLINLFNVYNISVILLLLCQHSLQFTLDPSLDGMNQEASNVTSTEYLIRVITMNLNLSMYFKAVCHRNVWFFTQFAIVALLYSGKAPSLHGQ